jgi:hypothetical protein
MTSRNKASDFLRAMNPEPSDTPPAPVPPAPKKAARVAAPKDDAKPASRVGLKHFGGYLDDQTLEKIALLRVRLKKDNSELIKFAIDELHRNHSAKRAFGDA